MRRWLFRGVVEKDRDDIVPLHNWLAQDVDGMKEVHRKVGGILNAPNWYQVAICAPEALNTDVVGLDDGSTLSFRCQEKSIAKAD